MKSNKGFTLIELLAVIVILAIIALIATPMILGVVEDARKSAAASSANGYIDAVEKQIMIKAMDNETLGTGVLTKTDLSSVNVKGDEPDSVSVAICGDEVTSYSLVFGKYKITKENGGAASKNDVVTVTSGTAADTATACTTSGSGSTGTATTTTGD